MGKLFQVVTNVVHFVTLIPTAKMQAVTFFLFNVPNVPKSTRDAAHLNVPTKNRARFFAIKKTGLDLETAGSTGKAFP